MYAYSHEGRAAGRQLYFKILVFFCPDINSLLTCVKLLLNGRCCSLLGQQGAMPFSVFHHGPNNALTLKGHPKKKQNTFVLNHSDNFLFAMVRTDPPLRLLLPPQYNRCEEKYVSLKTETLFLFKKNEQSTDIMANSFDLKQFV